MPLSTYAGYNVTVWPILQSLIQLEALYGRNWQTFIANCTIRQYFTVNDNFSADYVSKSIGAASNVQASNSWFSSGISKSNPRELITPDELRRESGKRIFMFINDLPPNFVDKMPYYTVLGLKARAKENPYL